MSLINKQTIIKSLLSLGIEKGDILYIKGNLAQIADPKEIDGKIKDFFVDALLECVGQEGTIITAAYTRTYLPFELRDENVFSENTKSYCGSLSILFMKQPNCIRSKHPTNSYIAIGPKAHYILDDHDENSTLYAPFGKLIDLNAKIITFGCDAKHSGFPVCHYVEEKMGLTTKMFIKGLERVYYYNGDGEKKLYKRNHSGGCLVGMHFIYEYYIQAGCLTISSMGRAIALGAKIKDIYDLDYKVMAKSPEIIKCDNPNCIKCNLLLPRQKHIIFKFFLYRGWITLFAISKQLIVGKSWKEAINSQADFKWYGNPLFQNEVDKIIAKYGPSEYERY